MFCFFNKCPERVERINFGAFLHEIRTEKGDQFSLKCVRDHLFVCHDDINPNAEEYVPLINSQKRLWDLCKQGRARDSYTSK